MCKLVSSGEGHMHIYKRLERQLLKVETKLQPLLKHVAFLKHITCTPGPVSTDLECIASFLHGK